MKRISKFQSILEEKCPRCREGSMFIHPPYKIKKFDKMYDHCPACGLKFDIEPGFYTGAMYVSYAFSVAIFIISGFILYFFFNGPDITIYVITTLIIVLILFPMLYRYARVVYLHLFGGVNFDPDVRE